MEESTNEFSANSQEEDNAAGNMHFTPKQAQVFGGQSIFISCGGNSSSLGKDGIYYLTFQGSTMRHLTSAKMINPFTLQAIIPNHNIAETVILSVICKQKNDSVTLCTGNFTFTLDTTSLLAQSLAMNSTNSAALKQLEVMYGALLVGSADEVAVLDTRLASAFSKLQLPETWSIYEDNDWTLLHLCAKYNLEKFARHLIGRHDAAKALQQLDENGQKPVDVASLNQKIALIELFSRPPLDENTDESEPVSAKPAVKRHKLGTTTISSNIQNNRTAEQDAQLLEDLHNLAMESDSENNNSVKSEENHLHPLAHSLQKLKEINLEIQRLRCLTQIEDQQGNALLSDNRSRSFSCPDSFNGTKSSREKGRGNIHYRLSLASCDEESIRAFAEERGTRYEENGEAVKETAEDMEEKGFADDSDQVEKVNRKGEEVSMDVAEEYDDIASGKATSGTTAKEEMTSDMATVNGVEEEGDEVTSSTCAVNDVGISEGDGVIDNETVDNENEAADSEDSMESLVNEDSEATHGGVVKACADVVVEEIENKVEEEWRESLDDDATRVGEELKSIKTELGEANEVEVPTEADADKEAHIDKEVNADKEAHTDKEVDADKEVDSDKEADAELERERSVVVGRSANVDENGEAETRVTEEEVHDASRELERSEREEAQGQIQDANEEAIGKEQDASEEVQEQEEDVSEIVAGTEHNAGEGAIRKEQDAGNETDGQEQDGSKETEAQEQDVNEETQRQEEDASEEIQEEENVSKETQGQDEDVIEETQGQEDFSEETQGQEEDVSNKTEAQEQVAGEGERYVFDVVEEAEEHLQHLCAQSQDTEVTTSLVTAEADSSVETDHGTDSAENKLDQCNIVDTSEYDIVPAEMHSSNFSDSTLPIEESTVVDVEEMVDGKTQFLSSDFVEQSSMEPSSMEPSSELERAEIEHGATIEVDASTVESIAIRDVSLDEAIQDGSLHEEVDLADIEVIEVADTVEREDCITDDIMLSGFQPESEKVLEPEQGSESHTDGEGVSPTGGDDEVCSGTEEPEEMCPDTGKTEAVIPAVSEPEEVCFGTTEPGEVSIGASEPREGSLGTTEPEDVSLGASEPEEVSLGTTEPEEVSLGASEPGEVSLGASESEDVCPGTTEPEEACPDSSESEEVCSGVNEPEEVRFGVSETEETKDICLQSPVSETDNVCLVPSEIEALRPDASETDATYPNSDETEGACLDVDSRDICDNAVIEEISGDNENVGEESEELSNYDQKDFMTLSTGSIVQEVRSLAAVTEETEEELLELDGKADGVLKFNKSHSLDEVREREHRMHRSAEQVYVIPREVANLRRGILKKERPLSDNYENIKKIEREYGLNRLGLNSKLSGSDESLTSSSMRKSKSLDALSMDEEENPKSASFTSSQMSMHGSTESLPSIDVMDEGGKLLYRSHSLGKAPDGSGRQGASLNDICTSVKDERDVMASTKLTKKKRSRFSFRRKSKSTTALDTREPAISDEERRRTIIGGISGEKLQSMQSSKRTVEIERHQTRVRTNRDSGIDSTSDLHLDDIVITTSGDSKDPQFLRTNVSGNFLNPPKDRSRTSSEISFDSRDTDDDVDADTDEGTSTEIAEQVRKSSICIEEKKKEKKFGLLRSKPKKDKKHGKEKEKEASLDTKGSKKGHKGRSITDAIIDLSFAVIVNQ
eukprot:gene10012-11035_t